MHSITANDLKTQGAALLNKMLAHENELAITIRGNAKYVVMPIEQYHHYRETELVAALAEAQADMAAGRVLNDSIEQHIKRVKP